MTTEETTETALAAPLDTGAMMALAIQQGPEGVEMLERLVALQERAEARTALAEFHQAMSAFHAQCPAIPKTSSSAKAGRDGGGFAYTYAKFETIVETIRPHLAANGLSFRFRGESTERGVSQTCIVSHVAGHSEESTFEGPVDSGSMNPIQKVGSGRAYAKRYALIDALGLATCDPDDDGAKSAAPDKPTLSEEQIATLEALIEDVGANRAKFLAWVGAADVPAIYADFYETAVSQLERKRGKGPV